MSRNRSDLNRRRFLLALGAGGAATAAGIAVRSAARHAGGEAQQPRSKGYQETEHVRNYYRTTRV